MENMVVYVLCLRSDSDCVYLFIYQKNQNIFSGSLAFWFPWWQMMKEVGYVRLNGPQFGCENWGLSWVHFRLNRRFVSGVFFSGLIFFPKSWLLIPSGMFFFNFFILVTFIFSAYEKSQIYHFWIEFSAALFRRSDVQRLNLYNIRAGSQAWSYCKCSLCLSSSPMLPRCLSPFLLPPAFCI